MGELHGNLVANSFGGAPFQQTWNDLPIWERFFNRYPCKSIVDFGTGQGGMALFFAAQAYVRGMKYTTFDRDRLCDERVYAALKALGAETHQAHIFDDLKFVSNIIKQQSGPIVLFCDNGDKPREYRTFWPLLLPGDFIAVHDWGAEIRETDIVPQFPMVMVEECESTDSVTRFFAI